MGDSYRRSVKIFIGGLSFETTDEALKRYFEQFGPVADAIVMKDAVSRRSRGFGFITYMSTASVDAALSVEQHIVDNRRVEAKRAVPRSEVPKMDPSLTASPLLQPAQSAWETGFGMEGYVLRGMTDQQRTRSNSTVSAGSMGGLAGLDGASIGSKIFVGGLHYETRDSSLQAYFEQFGPVTTAEVMFNRETHKSRGFGFVVFENEESANAVLQSTHHTVNGKVVEVKRAVPRSQSSTGGSNPSSPALMGYPPSPGALGPGAGGGNILGKAAAAAPKRTQRARASRDGIIAPNAATGNVPPLASPQQQRYAPTTSYATVLRYGAGRQQHANMGPGGGGKPPQHHGHMQGRDDIGSFRLHSSHGSFLPPSATARAEAAAAHAFVQELKAWDVENPGGGLNFDESYDYYGEQRVTPRDYGSHVDMAGGESTFNTALPGSNTWPGPGPGSGPSSRSWAQTGQGGVTRQQALRLPSDATRMLAHNSRIDDVSPRHSGHFSTFQRQGETVFGPESTDSHVHIYRSSAAPNGDDYHNGHGQKMGDELQTTRLLSPAEGGGTPALMGSSPLLGGGGLLETAFAELSLDGNNSVGLNTALADDVLPNGDGPSLLSGIGGGGPPSASSEVLPYGRAGGESAIDGGGEPDDLGGSSSWRADAFGSALGVNVSSTVNDVQGMGGGGGREVVNEGKDMSGGGLGDHFLNSLGTAGTENASNRLRWH